MWPIYEFDSIVHFIAGAGLALFFIWLYFFSGYFNPQKRNLKNFLFVSILGAMFIGISWEIYGFIFKPVMAQQASYIHGVMMNLVIDLLGALAGCFYAYIKEYNWQMIIRNINEQP